MRVRVAGVSFAYNGSEALSGVELDIKSGETFVLVGPNGSGKTTLLKAISGVLSPQRGAVVLDLDDLASLSPKQLAQRLAALEQEHALAFDFRVREVVAWGRLPHRGRLRCWTAADERAVTQALSVTGTSDLAGRSIQTLSGGERQRVFIAMALAQQPRALLLDEPTAHLDLNYQLDVLRLVKKLAVGGTTVVMALHDLNLAARAADRVALLQRGQVVACGKPDEVLSERNVYAVWGVAVRALKHEGGVWLVPR